MKSKIKPMVYKDVHLEAGITDEELVKLIRSEVASGLPFIIIPSGITHTNTVYGGNERVQLYLNVPFKEKDLAKKHGARFDGEVKQWYIPHGLDVSLFAKWLPEDTAQYVRTEAATLKLKETTSTTKSSTTNAVDILSPEVKSPKKNIEDDFDNPPWEI